MSINPMMAAIEYTPFHGHSPSFATMLSRHSSLEMECTAKKTTRPVMRMLMLETLD
jgi:hypothetical protein